MFLSNSSLDFLGSRYSRASSLRGRGESVASEVFKGLEVVGASGAMAYVNARYSDPSKDHHEVMGVPTDLLGGMLLTGLSLVGFLGKYDEHGSNIGSGLLSCYAVRMGTAWGANAKVAAASGGSAPTATKGLFAAGAPAPLYPTVDAQQPAYDWAA